jgi:hypothetical protein
MKWCIYVQCFQWVVKQEDFRQESMFSELLFWSYRSSIAQHVDEPFNGRILP